MCFKLISKQVMQSSFGKIIDKYRKISFSEKDKSERFERLMKANLFTEPKYAAKFKKIDR